MARFVIRGGRPLSGEYRVHGNKNAVLPMLAASLLTNEPVRLCNVPQIEDVATMLAILDDLGVTVSVRGHAVTLCAAGVRKTRLNHDLCRRVRSSILFAGPLAARFKRATLAPPGGDVIGRRPLDTHLQALADFGIVRGGAGLAFRCASLRPADVLLGEASVTATENALMAAVLAPGVSTLFNAACEPHVQDLCRLLNKMGARIYGIGTNFLRIRGVPALHGASHTIMPDYVDAGSVMVAAAVTGGELTIPGLPADNTFTVMARTFNRMGLRWTLADGVLRQPARQALRIRNDYAAAIPRIEDGVWPCFPSDLMSVAIVLATQAQGTAQFFEKLFESRLYFVDRLIEMGARIVPCDPHRIVVSGPARLHGATLSSPDIRAGMAMLVAALCARGESVIGNAECIDRGYERLEARLRRLGADITRMA